MTYEHANTGIVARWHGGAYIDLYMKGQPAPFDCINVWDYETDTPRIPRTACGLADRVNAWITDLQNNTSEEK